MTTEAIRKILTRDFILAFFAQLTFTLANHILIPTLPIYLSRLDSKETEIGVLIGSSPSLHWSSDLLPVRSFENSEKK